MKLSEYGAGLAYDIAFWHLGLENPNYPIDQLGSLSLELSDKFRTLAITSLLVHGDFDLFSQNLIRSARAREKYLQRLQTEGIAKDHHFASGRYEPLLDAIAANAFELAQSIAKLSPKSWQVEQEYEDDYCYAQILHRLIQENPPTEEIMPLLEQLEAYLGNDPGTRLEVCQALVNSNQNDFDRAFETLLEDRSAQVATDQASGKHEVPQIYVQSLVYVEGLAILRLAERRGLATQGEYAFCPSLARVPIVSPLDRDST